MSVTRRKELLALLKYLIAFLLVFTFCAPAFAAPDTVTVIVSGRTIADRGIVNKGVAYVPLHKVLSLLNVKYSWNPSQRTLTMNGKPVVGSVIRYKGVMYTSYMSISNNTNLPVAFDSLRKRVFINPLMSASDLSASLGGGKAINTPTPAPVKKNNAVKPAGAVIDEPFVPVTAENDVFKVSVTNLEQLATIKGQNPTSPSNKFVTVYLSQQNVSNEVQIYTGKFALLDMGGRVYEYIEGLSNFWLVVLRPGGTNFGYIVFEVPKDAQPRQLVLSTTSRPPLSLNLR